MEPKDGYQPGILRIVYVDIDSNGNITSEEPEEGFEPGVHRIVEGAIDDAGDFVE